jgi:hypothetical protein
LVIGVQHFGDGSTKPLYGGNQANVAIWIDYIQAHNDRDFDKIAVMNTPNFKGVAAHGANPDGTTVTAHKTIDVLLKIDKMRLLNVASQQMQE